MLRIGCLVLVGNIKFLEVIHTRRLKNPWISVTIMLSLSPRKASNLLTSTVYAVEGVKGNDGSLNKLLELMDKDNLKFYRAKSQSLLKGTSGRARTSRVWPIIHI
jgi:hypothetical protein